MRPVEILITFTPLIIDLTYLIYFEGIIHVYMKMVPNKKMSFHLFELQ